MNNELKFLIYTTPEEGVSVSAVVKDETIWLNQKAMAELFDVEVPAISKHLSNIYAEGELQTDATVSKMEIVQTEGSRNVKRLVDFYNLDAIISVGYRVNSRKATNFRIWATSVLKEYMTKGFAMDDERLKQGKTAFGKDYFRELLERTVTGYFDYIEDLIERENTFNMEEFAKSVNEFLAFRKYDILKGKGCISKKQAEEKAKAEYDEFNKTQKIISDFEKGLNSLPKGDVDE